MFKTHDRNTRVSPRRLTALLLVALALCFSGCSLDQPSPTPARAASMPTLPSATPTRVIVTSTATLTATATHTLTPTATPIPPTPTVTPVPAVSLEERMAAAEALRHDGEYERAVAEYAAVISSVPPPDVAAEALFQLGDLYFIQGDYRMTIDVYGHFVAGYPESPLLPAVFHRLALAHRQRGEWELALDHFQRYAAAQEDVPGATYVQIGEAHGRLGQSEQAIAAYERALESDLAGSLRRQALEELALLYRGLGQVDEAVRSYQRVLELTTTVAYRANLLYQIGESYRAAAQFDQAGEFYQQALDLYPEDYSAYLSLVALLEMEAEVDPLQRAIVDYNAGQYDVAIEILEAHIAEAPEADAPLAWLYVGLSHRQKEDWDAALEAFETITLKYPKSGLVPSALYQRARVLELAGRQAQAVSAYTRLVSQHPQDELADYALWQQALLLEEMEQPTRAAATYAKLAEGYATSGYADRARLRAGLLLYEAGSFAEAARAWERELQAELLSDGTRAQLIFWAGKAWEAQGEREKALARWQEAAALDPDGYYGLRAAELSGGAQLEVAPSERTEALFDLAAYAMVSTTWSSGCDASCQWAAALSASLGLTETLAEAADSVRSADAFLQGRALLAGGDRENALRQLEYAQMQVAERPLALYVLAVELHEMGLYRRAGACVDSLIRLAEGASLRDVPAPLLQISYPTHYVDLALPSASGYNIDPRLFLALIRQESRFDAQATSWAGARGLSQIMPTTGDWIAMRLGDGTLDRQKLYRPTLNVSYGLWYLAQGLDMFERHILAALAGYNGGPGNVSRWAGGLPIQDVDLFVENIGAAETRAYVETIWEQYNVYRWLYPIAAE